jgi:hypothetical protein
MKKDDELAAALAALKAILADMAAPDCDHLHHAKFDQHAFSAACPVENRLNATIDAARALTKEGGE